MYCVTRSVPNSSKQAEASFLSHLNRALTFSSSELETNGTHQIIICAYGVTSLGTETQTTSNVLQKFNFNFKNLFTYVDNSIRPAFACDVNNSRDRAVEHTIPVKKFTFCTNLCPGYRVNEISL